MYWLKLWSVLEPKVKVPDSSECSKLVKNTNVDKTVASQHGLVNPSMAKDCSSSSRFSLIRNHGRKFHKLFLKFLIRKTVDSNLYLAVRPSLACSKSLSIRLRSQIQPIHEFQSAPLRRIMYVIRQIQILGLLTIYEVLRKWSAVRRFELRCISEEAYFPTFPPQVGGF